KEEGVSAGISAGAACYAACKVAEELGPRENVVVIIPDTAERYFSFYQYF
ncbi:MAG TPA: cysteine synthase A, partial [Nitrospinaceae bacterium]|nr:cysteine synthase A [Nitrospinaceae bacterium]